MDRIAQNREQQTVYYSTSDSPLQYPEQFAIVPLDYPQLIKT
jgi:hypothetical protein